MRKISIFMALGLTLAIINGCGSSGANIDTEIRKSVTTLSVANEERPVTMTYLGAVMPDDMKSYAFKSPGRIGEVLVEVGDKVVVGDVLAELDTTDLNFQMESATWQLATATAQYEEVLAGAADEEIRILEMSYSLAKEAYALAQDQSEDIQSLYDAGYVSETEYKQVLLSAINAQTSLGQVEQQLSQARNGASVETIDMVASQLELAKVQYASAESLLEDAVIKASEDGIVIDVPYTAETLIDAGRPVVVTRSENSYIQLGFTQKDVVDIAVDDKVDVLYEDTVIKGKVAFIDEFADSAVGTYRVEIEPVIEGAFEIPFGTICEVVFVKGMEHGIWIPLTAVLNEGIDYVYLNQDGFAVKRRIDRLGIHENQVLVEGLEEGDLVIVEGILSINEGDLVEEAGGNMNE